MYTEFVHNLNEKKKNQGCEVQKKISLQNIKTAWMHQTFK